MRRVWAGVGGVAALVAGFAWAMRTEPALPQSAAAPQVPVTLKATEMRVVVRHRGTAQVDLRAQEAEAAADQKLATLKGVGRAVVFRDGKEFLTVRAQRIVLNRQTQNFVATGGVEITAPNGDWLRAPEVVYDNAASVLVFRRGVEFQIGENRARARTLRYHVQRDVVEVEGDVDVQLDVRSVTPPRTRGPR